MPEVETYTKEKIDEKLQGVDVLLFNRRTADYTLVAGDRNKIIEMDEGAADLIIPANVDVNLPVGSWIDVIQRNNDTVTIEAAVGVTINSLNTLVLLGQYAHVRLIKVATNEWYAFGDLTP
jgi:hypothetical protein